MYGRKNDGRKEKGNFPVKVEGKGVRCLYDYKIE